MGVARAVREVAPSCRVIALAGSIGEDVEQLNALGFAAVFGIQPGAVSPAGGACRRLAEPGTNRRTGDAPASLLTAFRHGGRHVGSA